MGLESHPVRTSSATELEYSRSILRGLGRVLWNVIRVPTVAILLLIEPVVTFVCSAGLVLGIVTCIVWEFSAAAPKFPLGKMLVFSFACPVILFLYHALLSLFVRDPR
jgi:hypothetical protein